MSQIVTHEDLKTATGYDRPGDIEKCLRKNGVRFLYGKKGIYTTIDALNSAMGLTANNAEPIKNTVEINII